MSSFESRHSDSKAQSQADRDASASREWLDLAQLAGRSAAWEWYPDSDELIFSSSTAQVFGVDGDLLPGTSKELIDLVPVEERGQLIEAVRRIFRTREPYLIEHRFRLPGHSTVWALARGEVQRDAHGHVERVVGVSADITEHKLTEIALEQEKERAQVTLSSISDGVVRTDAEGRIDFLNPTAERMLGVRLHEVRGLAVSQVYQTDTARKDADTTNTVERCLQEARVIEPAESAKLPSRDGAEHWVRESASPIFDASGELQGAVLVFTDFTQLEELKRRMEFLATHDPLTGLINRREFELRLASAVTAASRGDRRFALCYLDLDEFKVVNDTCGHGAGDDLLRQLTSVVDAVIPEGDTLARLGGDEFGILLTDCDLDQAASNARKVIDAVRQFRFQWKDRVFEIGASIGIVPVEGGDANLAELLSAADSACYVAKDRGRNEIHVSKADDSAVMVRHNEMRWVEHINRALEENRFRLFTQPIRPLQNLQRPQLNELLLRLVDVHGTVIAPSQFIAAAERYRMMPVIDLWVVGAALEMIGSLGNGDAEKTAAFTINLSGQSFGNDELKNLILDGLDKMKIPPRRVMFEITETAAISNLSQALDFMESLRDRGCRFVLDDFGSGLSSFRYLKSLEVEYLKIDGELVREIARNPIQREMVAAIHRIGESMGIQTIGEWVEDSDIERALIDIGVDYAQGWGVGRPVPFVTG